MRRSRWLAWGGCVATAAVALVLSGVVPSWAEVRRSSENFYRLWVGGQVTVAPPVAQPPFVLGANAQGQTVVGLDADTVDGNTAAAFEFFVNKGVANGYAGLDASGEVNALWLQSAGMDLGAADVNLNFGNTNGAFVTNVTTDGTITGGVDGAAVASTTRSLGTGALQAAGGDHLQAIAAGGTGQTTAAAALTALGGLAANARLKTAYGSANTVGAGGGTIDVAMPDNVAWTYLALVLGRKTDGSAGATYVLGGGARRAGGGAADLGAVASQLIVKEDAALGGCNCTEAAAGNAVRLTLTTVADNDMHWDAILFYVENSGA